jgi:TonB family protein
MIESSEEKRGRMRVNAAGVVCALLVGSFLGAQGIEKSQSPTTVEIRTMFSTQGYDFTSYLRQIKDRVRPQWESSIPATNPPGRAVIVMTIDRNGTGRIVRVTQSSGLASFDQAAIKAINTSKAFPAFPAGFSGNQVTIELQFEHVLVGLDPIALPSQRQKK